MEAPDLTDDDYARLPEGAPYELIGGCLVHEPSPTVEHQRIALRLAVALRAFVEERMLGEVLVAPLDVRLAETEVYQPDIVFVSRERAGILRSTVEGAPDLVIEVLSPSSGYYDLTHKRRVYELSGVIEYWIVDPLERTVEVLRLSGGAYATSASARDAGVVASDLLPGFDVDVAILFARPPWDQAGTSPTR